MTLTSIVIALLIGGLEALGLPADKLGLEGGLWTLINQPNENFGVLRYLVIGVSVAGWLISVLIDRFQRLDDARKGHHPRCGLAPNRKPRVTGGTG